MNHTLSRLLAALTFSAAILTCQAVFAEESPNLLEQAGESTGFQINPGAAAATVADVPDLTKPGAFAIQFNIGFDSLLGTKVGAAVLSKTVIPITAGDVIRSSFRIKGVDGQTATVVYYYLDANKQQIVGVWPKWPTGINLTPDWQEYEVEYVIHGISESPEVRAAINERAGGVVDYLSFAILIDGEGTVDLADVKLLKLE